MNDAETVLRRIVAIFATGDVSDVPALFDEDYRDHQGLDGAEIRGHDGFRRVVAAARAPFAQLEVSIEDVVASGEKVAARLRWHATRADGGTVVRETVEVLHLRGGRVVEHWGGPLGG